MSTGKHIDRICAAIVILAVGVTILFMNGEALGISVLRDADLERYEAGQYFTENDLNGAWDTGGASFVVLSGDSGTVTGNGAYMKDGDLCIVSSGRYVVSGSLSDGKIIVDANKNSKVWILLSGVDLYCSDDACIRVNEADKVFLTLKEGSSNSLESGTAYSDFALLDDTDGVIFAHDDLTINGTGTLSVTAGCRHGISANDDLIIAGGTVTVTAPEDGIRANDRLNIASTKITVDAGDDGISVNTDTGMLYLESGEFSLTSGDDGLHAASPILMKDGTYVIRSGDDAIHSDTSFTMLSGTLEVPESHEGIEAPSILISDGMLTIFAQDDGMNANRGPAVNTVVSPDGTVTAVRSEDDASPSVEIRGGQILIENPWGTDADGIDSNGDIRISGGVTVIHLLGAPANTPFDYGLEPGSVLEITGGTILGSGGAGPMKPAASDSQKSLLVNTGSYTSSNVKVRLLDSSGEEILSDEVPYSFTTYFVSTPDLADDSYTLVIGEDRYEVRP